MKSFGLKILVFLFVVSFFACDKEENEIANDIYSTWEAFELISLESVLYTKDDGYNPTIEFKKDGTLAIKLDVNSCFSIFEETGQNGLQIGMIGCTKICCDSDFSMKVIEMLPQVATYSLEANLLKLYIANWGWIELKRVSD